MSDVVIWKVDLADELKKSYKSKVLPNLKGYGVELTLDDDILDILEKEKDRVTPQRMIEDAQGDCANTVDSLAAKLKALDKDCDGQPRPRVEELCKDFDTELTKQTSDLGKRVAKIPDARWNKWVATRKQYKDYKTDAGFKVTIGILGAIGSGCAIAAAVPTGGASLALGIVGACRTGADLVKLGVDLWQKMETVQNSVMANLKKMKVSYEKAAGGRVMLATAINALIGTDIKKSVPVVEKDVELWSNKLAGVDVNGHKLGSLAMKTLSDIDKLEKLCNSKDVSAKIDKLRPKLDDLLKKTEAENARVTSGEKNIKDAEKLLEELKQKVPNYAVVFDNYFPIVVGLGLAGANAGVGFKEAKSALETANTAIGLANDLLNVVTNLPGRAR
jgi:hypothetical protein